MQKDEFGNDTLSVGELIEMLEKYPREFLVYTEGCDCIGNADGVEKQGEQAIIITRS